MKKHSALGRLLPINSQTQPKFTEVSKVTDESFIDYDSIAEPQKEKHECPKSPFVVKRHHSSYTQKCV